MDYQEVPLNLSRRSTAEMSEQKKIKQESDFSLAAGGQWNMLQNQLLLNNSVSWCFPPLAASYPQLSISPEHSLQYQSAYWHLIVSNLIRKSLEEAKSREESSFVPVSVGDHRFHHNDVLPLSPQSQTNEKSENERGSPDEIEKNADSMDSETSPKQRPKKAISPGKPSFKCTQCGVSYPHRFELNRHIKVSHIRPHRCEHCGKGFGHKNYLHVHIETVHLGKKLHKCDLCGKYLSTGGNLSVHVRTIHMGEKKYKCSVCSRTFGQQCNMKTHMKRHFCKQDEKRIGRMNSC